MWFYGKKRKIGKGNLYITENRWSWNEMWCTSDNHNHMCHTCAKEFFKFKLWLSSYWQNIKFSRYCPKFHIFTNIVIFKYLCNFLDQLLHPYKFHGRDMSGILFLIFARCRPNFRRVFVYYKFTFAWVRSFERKNQSCWIPFRTLISELQFVYLVHYS